MNFDSMKSVVLKDWAKMIDSTILWHEFGRLLVCQTLANTSGGWLVVGSQRFKLVVGSCSLC